MDERLLYRVVEVAAFLNISRSKVYELLASEALPSVRIDRTRLVRGSDLRAFVNALDPTLPQLSAEPVTYGRVRAD